MNELRRCLQSSIWLCPGLLKTYGLSDFFTSKRQPTPAQYRIQAGLLTLTLNKYIKLNYIWGLPLSVSLGFLQISCPISWPAASVTIPGHGKTVLSGNQTLARIPSAMPTLFIKLKKCTTNLIGFAEMEFSSQHQLLQF